MQQPRGGEPARAFEPMLLRPEEAAEALGLSRSTLYELLRQGDIDSIKVGRARRISPRALYEFIERQRTEGAS